VTRAHQWFDRVQEAADAVPDAQWLVDLAAQQKTNPKEYFDDSRHR